MIQLEGVSRQLQAPRGVTAPRDVSLFIERGDMVSMGRATCSPKKKTGRDRFPGRLSSVVEARYLGFGPLPVLP
jgi:hypothetical protein